MVKRNFMKYAGVCAVLMCFFPLSVGAEEDPRDLLYRLANACWKGDFGDGVRTDYKCFKMETGGAYLRSHHNVTGEAEPYSGQSLYRVYPDGQPVKFWYFSSTGGYSEGLVEREGSALVFPEERYSDGQGGQLLLRTQWVFENNNELSMRTYRKVDDLWQVAWSIQYTRETSE